MKKSFNTGDKVEIVNYGHLCFEKTDDKRPMPGPIIWEKDGMRAVDTSSEMVGWVAIIIKGNDKKGYSIKTNQGEMAWFDKKQLKTINKNPNTL